MEAWGLDPNGQGKVFSTSVPGRAAVGVTKGPHPLGPGGWPRARTLTLLVAPITPFLKLKLRSLSEKNK